MTEHTAESYRILIVDDSIALLKGVGAALEQAGYVVQTAVSGEDALDLMRKVGLPHLALVDINMPPGMDGLEFCESVLEFCDVPVIMLTAVGEEFTIVEALEQFAEDYVTKPFNIEELLARLRRVLRRFSRFAGSLDPSVSVDGQLYVNFARLEATVGDSKISLTATETKLLYILMRSAGETVPTGFILRRLWPREAPNEGRLRVNVHRLRQKLELKESEHRYITAVRGVGYGFAPLPSSRSEM